MNYHSVKAIYKFEMQRFFSYHSAKLCLASFVRFALFYRVWRRHGQ